MRHAAHPLRVWLRRVVGTAFAAILGATAASPALAQAAMDGALRVAARAGTLVGADGTAFDDAILLGRLVRLRTAHGFPVLARIDAIERPARDTAVTLYRLSRRDPRSGVWQDVCTEDAGGSALALPIPGRWTTDARYLPPATDGATEDFHVTCISGAIGKCALFGYAPWRAGPDGASLAPHFQACARMIRADYGGDGRAWTRDGTRITWHDTVVHAAPRSGSRAPETSFEAGWGPEGAICVAHARVPEVADLPAILGRYPRLADLAGPDRCTEAEASRRGALLFSRSAAP